MIFHYNIEGKLVTSHKPIAGKTPVTLTPDQAKICTGFDAQGNPIYDNSILVMEQEREKQKAANGIKSAFESACGKDGIALTGIYNIVSGGTVNNPKFQYDKDSWQMLESIVNDARVGFWRSLDNQNISLTAQNKTALLELLKFTYFTKFAESRAAIDAL